MKCRTYHQQWEAALGILGACAWNGFEMTDISVSYQMLSASNCLPGVCFVGATPGLYTDFSCLMGRAQMRRR